ncbi:MAG: hypothetical protein ACLFS9_06130 [Nitriliruptoraceae bacterium]
MLARIGDRKHAARDHGAGAEGLVQRDGDLLAREVEAVRRDGRLDLLDDRDGGRVGVEHPGGQSAEALEGGHRRLGPQPQPHERAEAIGGEQRREIGLRVRVRCHGQRTIGLPFFGAIMGPLHG